MGVVVIAKKSINHVGIFFSPFILFGLFVLQLGATVVNFVDSRIIFGAVPVNLTTTKVALLHNSGNNHAYFQVRQLALDST